MVKVELDAEDKSCFYLRIPFEDVESRYKVKKLGGLWNLEKKCWKFAFDLRIWDSLKSALGDKLEASPVFYFLIRQKKKEEQVFMSYKEIAEKDEPIDFAVEGISLNGKNPLFNYQRHGIKCCLQSGDGFLIGDQPGLGKSIQALGIAIERKNRGLINNCLIVCPASLKYNWLNEVGKFTGETALVIDGTKEERQKKWIAKGYFFKITNYETIVNDLYYDKKGRCNDRRIEGADSILSYGIDMLAVDEIHYIKSCSAIRSKALKQFKCKYRLGLTGTPVDGKLEELQSLFEFIKPGLFPSRSKFLERYADLDYFGAVLRYKNVQEVKDRIAPYYLRRLKTVVFKDLPEKLFKDVYVEMDPKEFKIYKDIARKRTEVTKEADAAIVVLRARQFCDFPELLDMRNPSAKFAALDNLLDELIVQNKEKIILFTQYKRCLDLLYMNLKDKYNIVQIHGEIGPKERVDIVDKFNNDKSVNIILMTDAGSVGLNLQEAHAVIHYDDNYSPAVMQQRNDRAHRLTVKHNVTIYRFMCKDTIEEKVRSQLEAKMAFNNVILDEDCSEFSTGKLSNLELINCL